MDNYQRLLAPVYQYLPDSNVVTDANQSFALTRGVWPATRDQLSATGYLKLGVCLSMGGGISYYRGRQRQQQCWTKGQTLVITPQDDATFSSPQVDCLGLAINTSALQTEKQQTHFQRIQQRPSYTVTHQAIYAMLHAVWTTAELHAYSQAFFEHALSVILACLDSTPSTSVKAAPRFSARQLHMLEEYIDAHVAADIKTSCLALLLNYSPQRFSDSMRATTGMRPYQYLTAKRMSHAKQLLQQGTSVTQAAFLVGYQNPSKFAAAYKRTYGHPPSQTDRQNQRR